MYRRNIPYSGTTVHVRHLTHVHAETDSRDGDSRYEHDRIWQIPTGQTFPEFWSWYVVDMMADYSGDYSPEFRRWTDADGYPHAEYTAGTDEGYRHEYVYGCDDECDPKGYRYRDHTAESMGY